MGLLYLVELKGSVTGDREGGLDLLPVGPVPGIFEAEVAPVTLAHQVVANFLIRSNIKIKAVVS